MSKKLLIQKLQQIKNKTQEIRNDIQYLKYSKNEVLINEIINKYKKL